VKNIFLFILFCLAVVIFFDYDRDGRVVVYDCRLSEISPDYPPDVKEECRKLHYNEWRRKQEEQKKEPAGMII
jgi:hypothetical protein